MFGNLPDHSDEGLNLRLVAFKEEEIRKIYINKVIYSILKYQKQSDIIKEYFKPKYEYVKNLHRGNFEGGVLEEVEEFLKQEKEKYNEVRNNNKEVVEFITPIVINNFKNGCHEDYDELQKIKYLLEYVSNTFKYNFDSKKYNYSIPFGIDYNLEFSNNVPVSDFRSLLITREVLSDQLASIIKILGDNIGLDIKIVIADNEENNDIHFLNAIILHKKINDDTYDRFDYDVSYIDAASYLKGEKNNEEAFLTSLIALNNDHKYKNFTFNDKEIDEEHKNGIGIEYEDIEIGDMSRVFENDRRLIDIEYIDNDVFEKKETSSK